MKCTEFEKIVNEYVDGELTHSLNEIEEHLETCTECQALYEETLELKALLNDLEEVELPDDFEASLHEKLVEVQNERKVIPFYQRFRGMKVVASVAALFVISFVAFRAGTMMPPVGSDNAADEAVEESAMFSANMADSNDMAMDDMEMEMAEEEVAMTMTAEPMAKGLRVSADAIGLAPETENYYLTSAREYDAVLEMLSGFKILDLMAFEEISFYLTEGEFEDFNVKMLEEFDVIDQLTLEVYLDSEDTKMAIDYQETYLDELKEKLNVANDGNEESIKNEIAIEEEMLSYLQEELQLIEQYKDYKFIVIRFEEE